MIKLNRTNWWVRLAYRDYPPTQTNICTLFWRGMWTLALDAVLGVGLGLMLSLFVAIAIIDAVTLLKAFGVMAAAVVGIICLCVAVAWLEEGGPSRSIRRVSDLLPQVPREAFKSWKEKHCALVRIGE